ncbi:MAG: hypothetical protein IH898_14305, partial [Planctomycetes bacterium]|nr:hypothetical protein [Planctomycetota bacterium]
VDSAAEHTTNEVAPQVEESPSSTIVESSTVVSETSLRELVRSLPSNLLLTNFPSVNRGLGSTLVNVESDGLDNPTPQTIDFALFDLLTKGTSEDQESYFALGRDDSEQSDAIDEAFQTLDTPLLGEAI